ncbi:MAG: MATE family efflux transporter [Legionella sp.]|nr:MATE family efflux transporter [Legionella sp.]
MRKKVGYIREIVVGNNDAIYTIFGIPQEEAYKQLQEHVAEVQPIISPIISILLTASPEDKTSASFVNHLIAKHLLDETITPHNLANSIDVNTFSNRQDVVLSFLAFDLSIERNTKAYLNPVTIQALSIIQETNLYVWELNDNERLELSTLYTHSTPVVPNNRQRKDVLLLKEGGYERITFSKLPNDNPTEAEVMALFEAQESLTNRQAFSMVFQKSVPFATARFLYALNTMLIGTTMAKLGKDQIAAGSLFTSLQYFLVGLPQGVMLSSGILYGEVNGGGHFAEVGKISRASWKLGLISSCGSIALLIASPYGLRALDVVNDSVQKYVEEYVNFFSIAVPPILLSITDQQIAVATKDALVPLGFILVYSGLASGLGIPMVLGNFGESLSGVKGYGISTAISAWLGFISARLYYRCAEKYKKYDLFQLYYPASDKDYLKELWSLGWKFGAQVGAEFTNLLGTTILLSAYAASSNRPALEVAVPSIQIASAWGLVAIALGQAQGNLIANERGAMKKSFEKGDLAAASCAKENITTLARQGLLLGTGLSAALVLMCILTPSTFTEIFLSNHIDEANKETANDLLRISTLGLFFDTIRNLCAGNLKGFKDVNFSTVASFISMTLIFVSGGAGILYGKDSLEGLMWLRNATIAAAMGMSAMRWRYYDNMSVESQVRVRAPAAVQPITAPTIIVVEEEKRPSSTNRFRFLTSPNRERPSEIRPLLDRSSLNEYGAS